MISNRAFRLGASLALAMLHAGVLHAAPPIVAKVESLQMPAWVERGGVKASIKAGWAMYAGDRITTGATGRLELTLAGDARVKLSGKADLTLNSGYAASGASLLQLSSGAVHIVASPMGGGDGVPFTIGQGLHARLTAGQAWAKADTRQDLMVLITGSAQIRGASPSWQMTEPETVLMIPHGGQAQPVIPVAPERLAQWLALTEPASGRPTLSASGLWDVSLQSGYNLKELEAYACKVQDRGFPSEIYPVRETGKQVWYRVMVRRFASRDDAMDFARLGKSLDSDDAWVLLPQQ